MQNLEFKISGLLLVFVLGWPTRANAAPSDADEMRDGTSALTAAREAFVRANELAKQMRWAEALADFQRSMASRPHAATAYNVGLCYRALGQYTRAYAAFELARARGRDAPSELTPDLVEDANAYVLEIQRLLVRIELTLEPSEVEMLVDGRSAEAGQLAGEPVWFLGIGVPNAPEKVPAARFVLVLDPGTHLLVFSRAGFSNVLVRRSFTPGERVALPLKLDSLPGRLNITASVEGAVVRVDSLDEGAAPVNLSRSPGRHRIEVRHPDYLDYGTDVVLRGGEETSFRASLQNKPHPITKRWWFWGAAATIIGVAVAATVIATRPSPQRPPVDGGSLQWAVDLR